MYETQLMRPNMKESFYVSQWCRDDFWKTRICVMGQHKG